MFNKVEVLIDMIDMLIGKPFLVKITIEVLK